MRGTFYLKSSILNIIYTIYLFKDAETDFLPLCSIESPKEWLAVAYYYFFFIFIWFFVPG